MGLFDRDSRICCIPTGVSFVDASWPGPPALGQAVDLSPADAAALAKTLGAAWAKA